MLTRREFLTAGSAALAVGALAGCAADGRGRSSARPTERPVPHRPAGRLSDIDHVVILMQENRSFDHYFGARRGVRGFDDASVVGHDGLPPWAQPFAGHPDGYLLPWHLDTTGSNAQCIDDPDHSWEAQHAARGRHGADGFAATMGARSLGYYRRADLPYYWRLADEFTLCDHSFCSVLGPTNPNRYMAMSASIDAGNRYGGPITTNDVSRSFAWPTYPERLQARGISWRVYHEVDDFDDNSLKFFARFKHLATTDPLYDAALRNRAADAFEVDAAAGNLPQVSWIVAPQGKSEHPLYPPSVGEDYAARKIAAVMGNAKLWAKTLFILSYDENGGFADHVAPPTPAPGTADELVGGLPVGLGYRVPTLLLSPWTRAADGKGRVVSDVYDHTSTLRLLETRFGVEVPNLSAWRRATCGDLSRALDLSRVDASVPALPTAARADAVIKGCTTLPNATPPARQVAPRAEPA